MVAVGRHGPRWPQGRAGAATEPELLGEPESSGRVSGTGSATAIPPTRMPVIGFPGPGQTFQANLISVLRVGFSLAGSDSEFTASQVFRVGQGPEALSLRLARKAGCPSIMLLL
jgi:hypothetical protein